MLLVNVAFPDGRSWLTHGVQHHSDFAVAFHHVPIPPCYDDDLTKGTPEGDTMGMLRTIIVVGAALAFLPSPPPGPAGAQPAGPGAFAYVAAAAETMADLRGFCQRNPNVCVTAGGVTRTVDGKARYSAKLIYEWANNGKAEPTIAVADAIQTGSPPPKPVNLKESQNTLTLADLLPEWKKPKG